MAQKIIVFYPAGSFGSTIEYCIRRFSTEFETIDAKICYDGSMHSYEKEYHLTYDEEFVRLLEDGQIFTPVYPNLSCSHPKETINLFKKLVSSKSKVIFITTQSSEEVFTTILYSLQKCEPGLFFRLINVKNNVKQWNQNYTCVDEMQRWELREYLSINLAELVETMIEIRNMAEEGWLVLSPTQLLNEFPLTIEKIIKFCNLTFKKDGLEEFAIQWKEKQQYILDDFAYLQKIIHSVVNEQDYIWSELNVFHEAIIQYYLAKKGILLNCYNLNNMPTSTQKLKRFLNFNQ